MSRASQFLARLFGRSARRALEFSSPENGHADLERTLGYKFKQLELLHTALTHPSAVTAGEPHYERLEFLGDAVLDLAIADLLMRRFPEAKEGTLSKERASIVNGRTLALKAMVIGLGDKLKLGKGEEKSGGRDKTSILAAAFEAVVGAIYTDSGLAPAQQVVETLFADDIGGPAAERDYKTELQEVAYRHFKAQPVYELVAVNGPDHAKRFTTRIRIAGRELGVGEGGSKKQSEQAAARAALDLLGQNRSETGA
ncbi:MAG TPA: ribonuclease III [Candidatus Binataceae bacterium]|nr:ribonuclease III [Candidatus Binataceae bacterium]